jgi:group II intron reverse transcriptase/maturase
MRQLELFRETAESPQGDALEADVGRPTPARRAVPKSRTTKRTAASATMTIEAVADQGNLLRAFEQVASNQGAPGVDQQSIEHVREHLPRLLPKLHRELVAGTYRPGMIRRVWIPKPGGGQRGLGIPTVVDRMVQQAVLQVMSPHYEPTFHDSSHGFRPGRSCHTAIAEARAYVEEGREWVVDIDLEKFFDRVNHERLLARLEQQIDDRRLIKLIRHMLKAKVVLPEGVIVSVKEGTPQGGPLSPLLSNIVLDELDRELAQRGHRFVRYADDAKIYVRSERAGQRVMESVSRFIEKRLRLSINWQKSAVARSEERHFVGFCLRREPEDGIVHVLLSERSKKRLAKRIRELTPRNWGQSLARCIEEINSYLKGWIGFFKICTKEEERTLHATDAHIRRRLRAIVLKHWKRKRTMAKRLIKLGVKPKTAWRGIYKPRRSWWALSHSAPVDRGLRNAYFAERGLQSLKELWREKHCEAVIDARRQLTLTLDN